MTRLTKSFSSGGASPISDPSPCRPRSSGFVGLLDGELAAPAVGSAEDHDVAGLRVAEPVGDLVDEHAVVHAARAAVQRGLHRPRGDDVDLGQERLDEEGQHQRDDDEDRQLAPERRPPAPARLLRPAARRRRRVARGRALRRRRAELTPPPRVAHGPSDVRLRRRPDPRPSGSPPSARRRPAGATPWRRGGGPPGARPSCGGTGRPGERGAAVGSAGPYRRGCARRSSGSSGSATRRGYVNLGNRGQDAEVVSRFSLIFAALPRSSRR